MIELVFDELKRTIFIKISSSQDELSNEIEQALPKGPKWLTISNEEEGVRWYNLTLINLNKAEFSQQATSLVVYLTTKHLKFTLNWHRENSSQVEIPSSSVVARSEIELDYVGELNISRVIPAINLTNSSSNVVLSLPSKATESLPSENSNERKRKKNSRDQQNRIKANELLEKIKSELKAIYDNSSDSNHLLLLSSMGRLTEIPNTKLELFSLMAVYLTKLHQFIRDSPQERRNNLSSAALPEVLNQSQLERSFDSSTHTPWGNEYERSTIELEREALLVPHALNQFSLFNETLNASLPRILEPELTQEPQEKPSFMGNTPLWQSSTKSPLLGIQGLFSDGRKNPFDTEEETFEVEPRKPLRFYGEG